MDNFLSITDNITSTRRLEGLLSTIDSNSSHYFCILSQKELSLTLTNGELFSLRGLLLWPLSDLVGFPLRGSHRDNSILSQPHHTMANKGKATDSRKGKLIRAHIVDAHADLK